MMKMLKSTVIETNMGSKDPELRTPGYCTPCLQHSVITLPPPFSTHASSPQEECRIASSWALSAPAQSSPSRTAS